MSKTSSSSVPPEMDVLKAFPTMGSTKTTSSFILKKAAWVLSGISDRRSEKAGLDHQGPNIYRAVILSGRSAAGTLILTGFSVSRKGTSERVSSFSSRSILPVRAPSYSSRVKVRMQPSRSDLLPGVSFSMIFSPLCLRISAVHIFVPIIFLPPLPGRVLKFLKKQITDLLFCYCFFYLPFFR